MKSLFNYSQSNLWFIWALLIAIIQIIIICVYPFNGYFGQDSYEYLKMTREFKEFLISGQPTTFSVFPGFYPLVCALVSLFIPNTMLVLQLVSAISLICGFLILREILKMLFTKSNFIDLYLFLFFVLSPYVLRFSIISMSDMFSITLWISSLYYSLMFQRSGKIVHLVIAAIFGGLTIMTRYPGIVILVMPAAICLMAIIQRKKYIYLIPAIFALFVCTVPDYIIRGRFFFWNIYDTSSSFPYFYFLDQYSLSNFFRKDFYNLDGWQHYQFPNIVHVLQIFIHPAFIFCGFLLLLFVRKRDYRKPYFTLLLISIFLYVLFLAGNAYQSNRYLMFVLPYLLILYYPAFERIARYPFIFKHRVIIIVAVVSIQLLLFVYSFQTIYNAHSTEKIIAEEIALLPESALIYSFAINGALQAYYPEVHLFDLYSHSISDSTLDSTYLLFNYPVFSKQFVDLKPMINYYFLEQHYSIIPYVTFESGWILYSLKPLQSQNKRTSPQR